MATRRPGKTRALGHHRVERAIRYILDSFFAARDFCDTADLNVQALDWMTGLSAERLCPEDRSLRVREVFERERPRLLPLPDNPFPTDERVEVSIGKTPYVQFALNDYSLPHDRVPRELVVFASTERCALPMKARSSPLTRALITATR
jgi:hypothetical protein